MAPPIKDVSVQAFAEIRGTSSQRIYQLIQEGMPHRKRKTATRIVPREALRWERERDKERGGPDDGKLNFVAMQIRKMAAEAQLKELELAKARGELIPAEIFSQFTTSFAGGFASVAAGQLGRYERDMVKVATPAEARELRMKIHTALMEGAQQQADAMDAEASTIEDLLAIGSTGDPAGDADGVDGPAEEDDDSAAD